MAGTIKIKNSLDTEFVISHQDDRPTIEHKSFDMAKVVDTVADMEALIVDTADKYDGMTCIVRDSDRGGTFVFGGTKIAEDNQGTNFNGWLRQYSGAVNVKWFGAKGDGVTDDTEAIQKAIDNEETIFFSSGNYPVSSTLLLDKTYNTITGEDMSSTVISSIGNTETLFKMKKIASDEGSFNFNNISFSTNKVGITTCFELSAYITDADHQVNGAFDSLIIDTVRLFVTGDGYWKTGLHIKDMGGVTCSSFFVENNIAAAQRDSGTNCILLEQTDDRVSLIRTLSVTNFYFQRFYNIIKTVTLDNSPRHIESLYISQGEMVGISNSALKVIGEVGAVLFSGFHVDTTKHVIDTSNAKIGLCRISACDFRQTINGDDFTPSAMLSIDAGEMLAITGSLFSGRNDILSDSNNQMIKFSDNYNGKAIQSATLTGCSIRNFYEVFGTTLESEISVSGNSYNVIESSVLKDDSVDKSAQLFDSLYMYSYVFALDDTGNQTVSIPYHTNYFGSNYSTPIGIMQQSSESGSDILTIIYDMANSKDNVAKFIIKGNTEARIVRFSVLLSGAISR